MHLHPSDDGMALSPNNMAFCVNMCHPIVGLTVVAYEPSFKKYSVFVVSIITRDAGGSLGNI